MELGDAGDHPTRVPSGELTLSEVAMARIALLPAVFRGGAGDFVM